ncbi:TetR family transcriptional regulator [Arthrobacter sp. TMN-37]
MRSAGVPIGADRSEDRTARARLRDDAVRLFGRDGFRVGLRAIARETGVSPALVLHHFGSKNGLREACDDYVLEQIRSYKRHAVGGPPSESLVGLATVEESAHLLAYAIRCLQEGGSAAGSFLDHFAEEVEAWLAEGVQAGTIRPSRNERARARCLTLQGFGSVLLDLSVHPPQDPRDFPAILRGYLDRHAMPTLELFAQGLTTDRSMLESYLMYVPDPPPEESAS